MCLFGGSTVNFTVIVFNFPLYNFLTNHSGHPSKSPHHTVIYGSVCFNKFIPVVGFEVRSIGIYAYGEVVQVNSKILRDASKVVIVSFGGGNIGFNIFDVSVLGVNVSCMSKFPLPHSLMVPWSVPGGFIPLAPNNLGE